MFDEKSFSERERKVRYKLERYGLECTHMIENKDFKVIVEEIEGTLALIEIHNSEMGELTYSEIRGELNKNEDNLE